MLKSSSTLNANASAANKKRKKSNNMITFLITMGIVSLCVGIPCAILVAMMANILAEKNLAPSLMYGFLPAINIIVIMISVFSVVSTFFFSTDNNQLLPMPIKPFEILMARFIITLLSTYTIVLMFVLPLFLGYGIGTHADVLYYISAAIGALIIPIVPLALIVLICVFIFQTTNLFKHKDLLSYIMTFFILVFAFSISFIFNTGFSSTAEDPDAIIAMMQNIMAHNAVLISKFMPNAYLTILSLTANTVLARILYTLATTALSLGILVGILLICSPIYFRTIRGSDEKVVNKKKTDEGELLAKQHAKGAFRSSVIVELRLIVRSPTYFMNLVFVSFIFPIITFISFFTGFSRGSDGGKTFNDFIVEFQNSGFTPAHATGFMIFFAILIFFASMTLISSTSISRMGKSASFVKYIPCDVATTVTVKAFWGIFFSFVTAFFTIVALVIANVFPIIDGVILLVAAIPFYVFLNYLAVIVDAKRPKLEWLNETQAVKSNTNGMLYMFGCWGVAIIVAGIGFIFMQVQLSYSGYILAGVLFILGIVGDYFMVRYLRKHQNTFFDRLA